jgi:putative spermidine/putrescine transport system ATP-binding protein
MADRTVVLRDGRIEQVGSAADLYDRPNSLFVNRFLGQTNLIPGRVTGSDRRSLSLELDCGALLSLPPRSALGPGERVHLSVRPENLALAGAPAASTIEAKVKHFVPLGSTDVTELESRCGNAIKISRQHRMGAGDFNAGATVHLEVENLAACSVYPAEAPDGASGRAEPNHRYS